MSESQTREERPREQNRAERELVERVEAAIPPAAHRRPAVPPAARTERPRRVEGHDVRASEKWAGIVPWFNMTLEMRWTARRLPSTRDEQTL